MFHNVIDCEHSSTAASAIYKQTHNEATNRETPARGYENQQGRKVGPPPNIADKFHRNLTGRPE